MRSVAERNPLGPLLNRLDDGGNGLLERRFPARARMNDQKISTEGYAAHEFIVESLYGASSKHRLRGREIDQIVGVNDERAEGELDPTRAKAAASTSGIRAGPPCHMRGLAEKIWSALHPSLRADSRALT